MLSQLNRKVRCSWRHCGVMLSLLKLTARCSWPHRGMMMSLLNGATSWCWRHRDVTYTAVATQWYTTMHDVTTTPSFKFDTNCVDLIYQNVSWSRDNLFLDHVMILYLDHMIIFFRIALYLISVSRDCIFTYSITVTNCEKRLSIINLTSVYFKNGNFWLFRCVSNPQMQVLVYIAAIF